MTVLWTVRSAPARSAEWRIHPLSLNSISRAWRNWQTRTVQVRMGATPWRFKSSCPHHRKGIRKDAFSVVRETCVNLHRERSRSQYAGARKYANGQQAACVIGEFKSSCPHQKSRQFACSFFALKSGFFAIRFCLSGIVAYTIAHGSSQLNTVYCTNRRRFSTVTLMKRDLI